jgi:hypothetical protein
MKLIKSQFLLATLFLSLFSFNAFSCGLQYQIDWNIYPSNELLGNQYVVAVDLCKSELNSTSNCAKIKEFRTTIDLDRDIYSMKKRFRFEFSKVVNEQKLELEKTEESVSWFLNIKVYQRNLVSSNSLLSKIKLPIAQSYKTGRGVIQTESKMAVDSKMARLFVKDQTGVGNFEVSEQFYTCRGEG